MAAVARVCWCAKLGPFAASWDSVTEVHFRGNDLPLGTVVAIGLVDQSRELFNLALDIEWYSYKASRVATITILDSGNRRHRQGSCTAFCLCLVFEILIVAIMISLAELDSLP